MEKNELLDKFSEIQNEILQGAFDITNGDVETIYIYGAIEQGIIGFNIFVKKDNDILSLNDLGIDSDRIANFLRFGAELLDEIDELFKEYDTPVPTEIKLIYDVRKETLDGEYAYDLKFTNSDTVSDDDIFNAWKESEKSKTKGIINRLMQYLNM